MMQLNERHAVAASAIGFCLLMMGCSFDAATTAVAADAVPVAAQERPAADGPLLSGRVLLKRTPPKRKIISMVKDPQCVKLHNGELVYDEELLVAEGGGVQNVFVYIRRGVPKREYPLPTEPALLDQKDCMYRPRVQGVRVGQKLLVANSDPVTHNVRSFPIKNKPFNFGQPPDMDPRERVFDEPEREIEVQCDFHPWMHAYIFVMEHPYYSVTSEDGSYAIADLPPGEYSVAVWHEKLGRKQQDVTIGASGRATLDFAY